MEHLLIAGLLAKRVRVHLVGVGGNGAQMAACLARLDVAMRALGHPAGLHVSAFDNDSVSESNVGRQMYSPSDVGQKKAVLTIQRLNLFYGLDWAGYPWSYTEDAFRAEDPDLVVSCVDTRSTRRSLHKLIRPKANRARYWLDLGNTESSGQVVLGESPSAGVDRPASTRLPCVTELFPELLDESIPDDNAPSCSVRMSLASQGLFVNDMAVRFAAQLLYELFSTGRLADHGVVFNLASKRSAPIAIDPKVWARYGYVAPVDAAEPRKRQRTARTSVSA